MAGCLYHLTYVLAYTGMRVSEALNADYDMDAQVIHIGGAKTVAGNRSIPIHSELTSGGTHGSTDGDPMGPVGTSGVAHRTKRNHIEALKDYQQSLVVNPQSLASAFSRYVKGPLGLSRAYSLHSIRHSVNTKLVEAGMPYHLLQRFMGHKSNDTTMRVYAKFIKADAMREHLVGLRWDLL